MTVCALLVLCGSAKAQVETDRFNTYSPYSIFGVGENSFSWGTAETQSMAGVGVSWMPAGVNNAINPASLASIRQTAYTVGASLDMSWYEDAKNSNLHKDIYFDYLVFSVPLTRTSGVSLGVTPYSTTGYTIYDRDSTIVDGSYKETLGYYDGNGGLTQIYLSYGRQVFRNFNLGISAAYLFGTIKRTTYNTLEDRLLQNKTTESNWVTGFKFRVGFNYSLPLVDQTRLFVGGVYDFSSSMNNDRTYRNYVVEDYNTAFDPDNPENMKKIPRTNSICPGTSREVSVWATCRNGMWEWTCSTPPNRTTDRWISCGDRPSTRAENGSPWVPAIPRCTIRPIRTSSV